MPIFNVGAAGTTASDSGYNIDNSLRFNSGSNDYLYRTPSSSGNRKTFTVSFWVKLAETSFRYITGAAAAGQTYTQMGTTSSATVRVFNNTSGTTINVATNQVFRDPSAWYHIVFAIDSTQGTASNRVKIYVNGTEATYSSTTYPDQNLDLNYNQASVIQAIGARGDDTGAQLNGYLSEYVFIDGQQLTPTSFGEFDEDNGIWKPIDGLADDLTFGTNGFYLEFKESGTSQNSSGLGADTSGNGNHYAVNNLTAVDQSTDTPTNNFCTLNALSNPVNGYTLSNGNLESTVSGQSFTRTYIASTIAPETGKWYWESKLITSGGSDRSTIGISSYENNIGTGTTHSQNEVSIATASSRIRITENGDGTNTGGNTEIDGFYTIPSANDIFMYALDLDNKKYYFGINGVWWNYNTAETGGDPTSGSGYVTNSTNIIKGAMSLYMRVQAGAAATTFTNQFNFGSPPYAISSGNSDGNGHGNFEYAVPSGYYALNTKNLAEFG